MTLILTPQAEKDFKDAHDWYENQDPGLGKEFVRCVDGTWFWKGELLVLKF